MTPAQLQAAPHAPSREDGDAGAVPETIAFPRAMDARFKPAFLAVTREMQARDDVVALLCFGSAQRGTAKAGSDLDVCALTRGNERWTRGGMMEGVEVQVQLGPVRAWRDMVEKRHPAITSGFATGQLLFDRTGEATEIKKRAEEVFHAGPPALSPFVIDRKRYALTNMVRDLEDLPEHGAEAGILCGVLLLEALKAWCAFGMLWSERKPHVLMRLLRQEDPALAATIDASGACVSTAATIAFTDRVLEMVGGRLYEFTTPPEPA